LFATLKSESLDENIQASICIWFLAFEDFPDPNHAFVSQNRVYIYASI